MEDFDQEYEESSGSLHQFRLALEGLIQVVLEQEGIKLHSVTSRVKPKSSTLRKLQRPDKQRRIGDLTDLLGVRIITYFPDEVDAVATLIEREFLIDRTNSVDKRAILDPDRFGYLSMHYVAQLNESRAELAEYRSYRDIRFEVQIRSILQHAWAEIEHDLGYKQEAEVQSSIRRRFSRLAGLLEVADDEFVRIRREITESTGLGQRLDMDVRASVELLLNRPRTLTLPAWPKAWREAEYIAYVAGTDSNFVHLDRVLIEIPATRGRFEACDLLGPNEELIHVSRPRNSASYSHLFNQALVSAEILIQFTEARTALADAVGRYGNGRVLSSNFRPRQVVLAFPSSAAPAVDLEKIPPFSRVTLARIDEVLDKQGVSLRIVGIDEL